MGVAGTLMYYPMMMEATSCILKCMLLVVHGFALSLKPNCKVVGFPKNFLQHGIFLQQPHDSNTCSFDLR